MNPVYDNTYFLSCLNFTTIIMSIVIMIIMLEGVILTRPTCFWSGPLCVQCTNRKGKTEEITAKYFIVATGCRPKYPDVPGVKEFAITRWVGETVCVPQPNRVVACNTIRRPTAENVITLAHAVFRELRFRCSAYPKHSMLRKDNE